MRRRDSSGECTKLGLRLSNPPRHGTNVAMMSRAAHGRFEHVAASPHGRLREARGQDGQKGKSGRVMRERESHENDSEVRLLFSKGPGGATRTWTRPPRSSKTTGGSSGKMRRRDRSGECTKLGLRPSNSPRHGTSVTMMSRAAHGRFEHVAASQHGRLSGSAWAKGQGRKGGCHMRERESHENTTRLLRVLTVSQICRVEASATPLPSHVSRSSSRSV